MALIKSTLLQEYFNTPMHKRTATQRNEAWASEWQGNARDWASMKKASMQPDGSFAPIYDERIAFCEAEASASLVGLR